jgi:hypothetical protein
MVCSSLPTEYRTTRRHRKDHNPYFERCEVLKNLVQLKKLRGYDGSRRIFTLAKASYLSVRLHVIPSRF